MTQLDDEINDLKNQANANRGLWRWFMSVSAILAVAGICFLASQLKIQHDTQIDQTSTLNQMERTINGRRSEMVELLKPISDSLNRVESQQLDLNHSDISQNLVLEKLTLIVEGNDKRLDRLEQKTLQYKGEKTTVEPSE